MPISDEMVEAAMRAYREYEHRDPMKTVYPKERMRAALAAAEAVREGEAVVVDRTHYDALVRDHQKLTAMLASSGGNRE